ncbi:MAG TPA: alpha/beta fold hydrolase [Micromonosporaceae bacterium]|nr:alpha/beta fold hydrolase [Micromonosporaceae bacterium]
MTQVRQPAWLRRFHQGSPHRPALLCFPHAGGSASSYVALSAALAPSAEVLAVQYPGRQDRLAEPPLTDMRALARQLVPVIRDELDDRPYACFGHSMGAALAFEVTRQLEQSGTGPVLLFASGRRAPSVPITDDVHRRDDAGLVAEVQRFDAASAQMLEHDVVRQMVLPALRADYTANETYWCPPEQRVACPVVALVGDDDPVTRVPDAQAWQAHTTATFLIRVFRGGHFFLNDRLDEVVDVMVPALIP